MEKYLFRCVISATDDVSPSPPSTTPPTPSTTSSSPPPLPPTNSTCNCGVAQRETRVINGDPTEVHEYPWMVSLFWHEESRHWCGGSIISPHHVLTAAHCTYGKHPASDWTARVGMHNYTDWAAQPHCPASVQSDTQSIAVAEILEHPNYREWDKTWDVAILTLASPITYSTAAAPVCLPASASPLYDGLVATVAGWGTVTHGSDHPPCVLQEANLTVITNSECDEAIGNIVR